MPTDGAAAGARAATHPLAARRILRLGCGTAIALAISQAIGWPLSFVAPLLTLMILALPLPAPGLKQGVMFITALLAPMLASLALLPFLEHARWSGILLVGLALFYSFYYTARGGSPVLGNFMTIGITLVVTIGSVSGEVLFTLILALAVNAVSGMAFVWLAHALLPDLPAARGARLRPPPAPVVTAAEARRGALRALLIVFPVALVFLFMSGSPGWTAVMIKMSTMGQQASADRSRQLGRSMLASTLWGGLAAIGAWCLLSAWPSLALYALLVALAGLQFGRRIFLGSAVHPDFSKWSYAFLTMLILLAPAVLDHPATGGGTAFWWRLWLFLVIAVYGTLAVALFDRFWPARHTPLPG